MGLRFRVWLGCLGGSIVAGVGLAWLIALPFTPSPSADTGPMRLRLALVIVSSLMTGIVMAAWLDRGIVRRVRQLARAADRGAWPAGNRRSPAWGEIAALETSVETLLTRLRQLTWSADAFERLKVEIADLRDALERWVASERWEAPAALEGPLKPLLDGLNRGFARQQGVIEQNREAVRQVQAELSEGLEQARACAEQAEHGFVEATALLTSVQELQRLAAELPQRLDKSIAEPRSDSAEPWREAASAAIEELVSGASESVEHLAAGFLRVQEIGEQVHMLSNRATLIALHTLLTGTRPEDTQPTAEGLHAELKQLSLEVRGATSKVTELSHELEREIQEASRKMRAVRQRVAERLEGLTGSAAEEAGVPEETRRLLERTREMVQDALRKSERLARSSEHASRAAQDVVKRLIEQNADLEGLHVRLMPPGTESRGRAESAADREARTGLKVVERRADEGERRGRTEGEMA